MDSKCRIQVPGWRSLDHGRGSAGNGSFEHEVCVQGSVSRPTDYHRLQSTSIWLSFLSGIQRAAAITKKLRTIALFLLAGRIFTIYIYRLIMFVDQRLIISTAYLAHGTLHNATPISNIKWESFIE